MEIKIFKITKEQPEQLEIRCHEITEQVREIITFVKSRQGQLNGMIEGKQYEIPIVLLRFFTQKKRRNPHHDEAHHRFIPLSRISGRSSRRLWR